MAPSPYLTETQSLFLKFRLPVRIGSTFDMKTVLSEAVQASSMRLSIDVSMVRDPTRSSPSI